MHVTSSPAIWYAARASGVAAYVVLSLVVCLGLTLGGKAQSRRWPRFSVEDVHRFGGLLVGSLLGACLGHPGISSHHRGGTNDGVAHQESSPVDVRRKS